MAFVFSALDVITLKSSHLSERDLFPAGTAQQAGALALRACFLCNLFEVHNCRSPYTSTIGAAEQETRDASTLQ